MERNTSTKTQSVVLVGIMSAMVFALSYIRIMIPSPDMKAAIHLGNIMCVLSGLLFGGTRGGLSAGIGSMFYDFTNPAYVADAPITFINKFVMGFTAGLLNCKLKIKNIYLRAAISAACGQLAYLILYLTKSLITDILNKSASETIAANLMTKAAASSVNAVITIICVSALYAAVRNIIVRTPFKNMLRGI